MQVASFSKYLVATVLFSVASFGFVAHAQQTGGGQPAEQDANNGLSGYAWSSNIGWVSLSGSNYGVTVASNGVMSGYAWSSNIGWISFNASDLGGCPSGSCQAHFDSQTGDVTGWAKAIAGGSAQSGNWDGWIYLGQSSNVGISATECTWSGYAWGGGENNLNGVIGWLSFAGPGYGVTGSGYACNTAGELDLTAGRVTVRTDANETTTIFTAPITNIGSQVAAGGIDARIQIAYNSDQSAAFDQNIDIDAAVSDIGASESKSFSHELTDLQDGKHQVRVCVDPGNEIAEDNENNNCGPVTAFEIGGDNTGGGISFSCSADKTTASVGETVTWSVSGVQGTVGTVRYSWAGSENLSGTSSSVRKTYSNTGTKTATLTVTAENGSSTENCTTSVSGGGGGGVVITSSPTVDLNAYPDRFVVGGSTRIVWNSENYTGSCTATGFDATGLSFGSSSVPANGSIFVTPPAGRHPYSIQCGSARDTKNVTVLEPTISITANGEEELVRIGKDADPVAIVWQAKDVDRCTVTADASGFPASNTADSNGEIRDSRAPTVTSRTTFTLTCQAVESEYVTSVTVNIPPDFEEF